MDPANIDLNMINSQQSTPPLQNLNLKDLKILLHMTSRFLDLEDCHNTAVSWTVVPLEPTQISSTLGDNVLVTPLGKTITKTETS